MSLFSILDKTGQFPAMQIQIVPIDPGRTGFIYPVSSSGGMSAGFLDYEFDQNMLVPCDAFSFTFAAPDGPPAYELIKEGDEIRLLCNNQLVSTGIVDTVEILIDAEKGETINIRGRDMMSQLEMQSCANDKDGIIYNQNITIENAVEILRKNTRIKGFRTVGTPNGTFEFPTQPGESKLSALQRFMEPLNVIAWMDPDGTLVVGKPNFGKPSNQDSRKFFASATRQDSNALTFRVTRNGATIPNRYLPIWSAQEQIQNKIPSEQIMFNKAKRPNELLKSAHRVTRAVVTSPPSGHDPTYVNALLAANIKTNDLTASGAFIKQFARRQMARDNIEELKVDIEVPGHYDSDGNPYKVNTVYHIEIERASVDQYMFCHAVKYRLDPSQGQMTTLSFINLYTIVADAPVQTNFNASFSALNSTGLA